MSKVNKTAWLDSVVRESKIRKALLIHGNLSDISFDPVSNSYETVTNVISSTLKKNGVWPSKINSYLALIKNSKTTDFLELNQELLKVDLMNKGILKPNPWEQIEKIILKLKGATS